MKEAWLEKATSSIKQETGQILLIYLGLIFFGPKVEAPLIYWATALVAWFIVWEKIRSIFRPKQPPS